MSTYILIENTLLQQKNVNAAVLLESKMYVH